MRFILGATLFGASVVLSSPLNNILSGLVPGSTPSLPTVPDVVDGVVSAVKRGFVCLLLVTSL